MMMKKMRCFFLLGLTIASISGLRAQAAPTKDEVSEMQAVSLLEIYPNPTSSYLNIEQQQFDGSISQLRITDLSGHMVYQIQEKFTQLSIFVGNWQKGVYMVFFRQGNKEVMKKIVVQ
ncbi:T9SS type A sorting domain-containing protein [Reichenbachiella carrageenanivorans]|uniref:T9SS type A sorting domain-containing protein n=1 Tax=Reichenbachiella carrageenanivorans TaxID=2979869 RepID=A0ABY6D049_9BACT|nr:T9SS type A sorting domain-containing protein [Reichenbachiella carrageenanivorans]UXX79536.1 T9SS type A sorting domain-containing protein [Reichenbachiella carrageenanivorans]